MELVKMKEAEGLVAEAADILQELQVHICNYNYSPIQPGNEFSV